MRTVPTHHRSAFSLIELLLVVAVIMLLMTMAQMALSNVSNSTRLSTSAQVVGDAFNLARQIAVAQNQYVQVRLFSLKDTPGKYSVIGIYRSDMPYYLADYAPVETAGKMRKEGQFKKLQDPVVLWSSAQHSTLLSILEGETLRKGTTTKIDGKDYDWVSFYFRPDGAMDVKLPSASTDNFATLTMISSGGQQGNQLPQNFVTLTLDPINGRFRVLRP
jgi:uncharacterized protein (TIGR02596 family)